jgi:hypothetical protein
VTNGCDLGQCEIVSTGPGQGKAGLAFSWAGEVTVLREGRCYGNMWQRQPNLTVVGQLGQGGPLCGGGT